MSSLNDTRERALLNERLQNLDAQLRIAQQRWDNITIRGPGWAGDSAQGFTFNPRPSVGAVGGIFPATDINLSYDAFVTRCCFVVGGTTYYLSGDPSGSTLTIPSNGTNSWGLTAALFNSLDVYFNPNCPNGVAGVDYNQVLFGGGASVIFSGGTWTIKEWTTVGATTVYQFNGTASSTTLPVTVPNGLTFCGGNAAFGGSITLTL